jgi:muramoyltetrapeptide carboxypeptidase
MRKNLLLDFPVFSRQETKTPRINAKTFPTSAFRISAPLRARFSRFVFRCGFVICPMLRKQFFLSIFPATVGAWLSPALAQQVPPDTEKIVPDYLQPGDTIGICCPAGYLLAEDVENCVQWLKVWGWRVKLGRSVGDKWFRLAGTDESRLADLQTMLDDPELKAILFGKGGYGYMRIMDGINWEKFRQNPKWLIGFSDITALHLQLQAGGTSFPSIHSIMASSFKTFENHSMYSLKMALKGQPIDYQFKPGAKNRLGKATGILIGGNLSLLVALQGSKSEMDTRGKILFIEDVGEYMYTVDRMLLNLKRSGKLDGLAALLVGGFTNFKQEKEGDPDRTLEEVVWEKVKDYDYPVAFDFPSGHQPQNMALKMGMRYELNVVDGVCGLKEV